MEPLWRIASDTETSAAGPTGLSPLMVRLLRNRGARTPAEAAAYLHPERSRLHDPLALRGAPEAADRLWWAARNGRRVVVFGDYDVDGVTAVAQLRAALRRGGADARAFIPHRLRDGYGFKPETVRAVIAELAPDLLITVDCGITARDGVACARDAGVDVIVTDHHLVPDELPTGALVINPKQPGCAYPEKELAGSGIAFRLAEAFGTVSGTPIARESLLRLACLGTIADMVPLRGENRVIAAAGLAALSSARSAGLRALLAECGVAEGRPPTAEEVSFRIAPRLNAAGRVDTAATALALFELREKQAASAAARQLTMRNVERQSLERRVVTAARERLAREADLECDAVLIAGDAAWHRGVLGIAAARLAREFHRPVLLFALEGERASGSGRSIPGVSIHAILQEMSEVFLEFGGHDQAVGASLPATKLAAFREDALRLFAARVPPESLVPVEEAEAELPVEQVTEELFCELEALEPHGMGNPRPVFYCRGAMPVRPFTQLGDNGLRGQLDTPRGPIACHSWNDSGPLRAGHAPLEILYRLCRGRSGAPQVEILRARR